MVQTRKQKQFNPKNSTQIPKKVQFEQQKSIQITTFQNCSYPQDLIKSIECVNVIGDGNCFYRAVAVSLGKSEDQYREIKQQLIKELENNQSYYTAEAPVGKMSLSLFHETIKIIGTEYKFTPSDYIKFVSNCYSVVVCLHTQAKLDSNGKIVCEGDQFTFIPLRQILQNEFDLKDAETIHINWGSPSTANHFQSLQNVQVYPDLINGEKYISKQPSLKAMLDNWKNGKIFVQKPMENFDSNQFQQSIQSKEFQDLIKCGLSYEELISSYQLQCNADSKVVPSANDLIPIVLDQENEISGENILINYADNSMQSQLFCAPPSLISKTEQHVQSNHFLSTSIPAKVLDYGQDLLSSEIIEDELQENCENVTKSTKIESDTSEKIKSRFILHSDNDEASVSNDDKSALNFTPPIKSVPLNQIPILVFDIIKNQLTLPDNLIQLLQSVKVDQEHIKLDGLFNVASTVRSRSDNQSIFIKEKQNFVINQVENGDGVEQTVTGMPDGTQDILHDQQEQSIQVTNGAKNQLYKSHGLRKFINDSKFVDFQDAFVQVKNFSLSEGYELIKKDSASGRIVCKLSGKWNPRLKESSRQSKKFTKKTDCSFKLSFSKNLNINAFEEYHNHPPLDSNEITVRSQSRENQLLNSDKIKIELEILRKNTNDWNLILNVMNSKFPQAFFTKRDLQELAKKITSLSSDRQLSISKVLDNLMKRKDEGWVAEIETDDQGCLKHVLWSSKEMQQNLLLFGETVLIDTTYQKNEFNLPMAVISLLDNEGTVRIGAVGLLGDETKPSFEWFFNNLQSKIGWKPCIVFSDGDLSISGVLNQLSGVRHFLCRFHLKLNLLKNCRSIPKNQISVFLSRFYVLCQIENEAQFLSEWDLFLDDYQSIKETLTRSLGGNNIKKWPYCYQKDCLTLEITTTSVAESVNSAFHSKLDSHSSVTQVIDTSVKILCPLSFQKSHSWRTNQILKQTIEIEKLSSWFSASLIEHMTQMLSSHAVNLSFSQMNCALVSYEVVQSCSDGQSNLMGGNSTVIESSDQLGKILFEDDYGFNNNVSCFGSVIETIFVQNKRSKSISTVYFFEGYHHVCSCSYNQRMGMPCRHFYAALRSKSSLRYCVQQEYHKRWIVGNGPAYIFGYQEFETLDSEQVIPWNQKRRMMKSNVAESPLKKSVSLAEIQTETFSIYKGILQNSQNDVMKLNQFQSDLQNLYNRYGQEIQNPPVKKRKGAPKKSRLKPRMEMRSKIKKRK